MLCLGARIDMRDREWGIVYYGRYIVTSGAKSAAFTTWWGKSEKSERRSIYLKAVDTIREKYRNTKTYMETSNVYSLSIREFATIHPKTKPRKQRRAAGVYGFLLLTGAA